MSESNDEVQNLINLAVDQTLDPEARGTAIVQIAKLGDKRAVQPLLEMLKNDRSDPDVLSDVVLTLGKLGDKRATEPLLEALGNMGYLDDRPKPAILEEADDYFVERSKEFWEQWEIEYDKFYYVSRPLWIVSALATLADMRALEPLMHMVKRYPSGGEHRSYPVYALGEIGDERALPVLEEALNDHSEAHRMVGGVYVSDLAAEAIEKIKSRKSVNS